MNTTRFWPILAWAALLLMAVSCRREAGGMTEGETLHTLAHNGAERSYILHTPPGLDSSVPAPLVFMLHGGGGNAENAVRMSEMDAVAEEHGFLVVYPNGSGRFEDNLFTWNAGSCCGFAQENNADDVGFIRAIAEDLQNSAAIDPKRIYAAGMSNGAMLSYRLACEASDLFAAVAPVAGTLNFSPCQPSQPVAVIHFHGAADEHVPFDGGRGAESASGADFVSVQDSLDFRIAFNGCDSQPQTNSFEDVQHQVWGGCADSSSVELYTIIGGKHAWPGSPRPGWAGGDAPTQSISASNLMWEFFAAHPKP